VENQFIHRILDSRLQLEFDFAVVISITVNTADSRKVMQRPTVSQHASGGGCSFAQHRLTQPNKLFESDHGIRFINGPTDKDSRAPAGICWLGTCPATLPRGHPAAWRLGHTKPLQEDEWGLAGPETLRQETCKSN
jgi:hypothetical protein